jgi:hypothetical protein
MDEKEPTQRTETGYEIPVPKRGEVDALFERAAKPLPKPKKKRRPRSKS